MFWLAVIMATARQDNVNVRTQKHAEPKAHKRNKKSSLKKSKIRGAKRHIEKQNQQGNNEYFDIFKSFWTPAL